MKFTALPVRVGNAFLLRSPSGTVLVDGGEDKVHILDLLKPERLKKHHIDLLVCTHYDADHVQGILGILESRKYTFREIWLPEVLGSLSYTISKNLVKILARLRELDREGAEKLMKEAEASVKPETESEAPQEAHIRVADLEAVKTLSALAMYPDIFSMILIGHWDRTSLAAFPVTAMFANLSAAISTVSLALSSGAHIRWFKYSKSLTNKQFPLGMTPMNSTQTALTEYKPDVFLQQLYVTYITPINRDSLVFKFSHQRYPDILFCADSNFSFTTTQIQLKNNSIVTAPHHGASDCDAAMER